MEEERKQQEDTEVMEEKESEKIGTEVPAENAPEDVQVEDTEVLATSATISGEAVAEDEKHADILYLGIDLGTYRSAITASNGKKSYVLSMVGWPKDAVALRLLGKPILFGEEAMMNRLSLDLHRPLERGVLKEETGRDRKAVRELVRHVIEIAEPFYEEMSL